MKVVVMGVCGCGKTAVGERLAAALGCPFIEGDAYHPPQNVDKMRRGVPLTDGDRASWLSALARELADRKSAVIACSALKRRYRSRLQDRTGAVTFLHLAAPRTVIAGRLSARTGHYMPPGLLDSQLAILEPPGADEPAVTQSVESDDLGRITHEALRKLRACVTPETAPATLRSDPA